MCNKDCFNCPYSDCIRPENEDAREYGKRYREAHGKEYYEANKDSILKQQMEKYYSDIEKGRLKNRNNWDRHKDIYNARRREERRMLKKEVR